MVLEIRPASSHELNRIYDFYRIVCNALESAQYSPLWQMDCYPCMEDIKNHISNRDMYIALYDSTIVGAMAVVNYDDYASLHLLAVHPDYRRKHLSDDMMKKLFQIAEERKNHKIVLDVIQGNLPAEKLYQKVGFKLTGEREEFIARIGSVCFNTYECWV